MFNVWDRIEDNEFADVVTSALASFFPADPPRFMARTPHGYHDRATIEHDLRGGGFATAAQIDTVAARSTAPTRAPCRRSPTARARRCAARSRRAIAARLGEATDFAAAAIARRFGAGPVDAKIQAHVVAVER